MRRKILTIALATAAGWSAPAMAQVVVGGQGNSSVIVDYSVIGLPGGNAAVPGGYPYGSHAPGGSGPQMPNGQAPRSQFLAGEMFGDTTVIGGGITLQAPSQASRVQPGGGSMLTPEAAALLGNGGVEAPPPAAAPKLPVQKAPAAPAEVAKAEPKIEVTRPTPPAPEAPKAQEPEAKAPEPKQEVAAAPPPPEPKPEPAPAAEPVATPPAPPQSPAPAPAAAPAPPAPAPPAPAPTQEAKADPGPVLSAGDSSTLTFQPGEVRLPAEGTGAIERIAEAAVADEEIRIQLLAYASADGGPSSTARRISLRRALNVRKVLIDKGVRAARIDVRALGNKVPDGNPDRVDVAITRR